MKKQEQNDMLNEPHDNKNTTCFLSFRSLVSFSSRRSSFSFFTECIVEAVGTLVTVL